MLSYKLFVLVPPLERMLSMITDVISEKIHSLPCFREVTEVVVLPGGLTNQNFKVTDAKGTYVVRFSSDLADLGLDREVELSCLKNAESIGVAPHLVYSETGVLVTNFVEGGNLTDETANSRDVLSAVVNVQRHGSAHDLDYGEYARKYFEIYEKLISTGEGG